MPEDKLPVIRMKKDQLAFLTESTCELCGKSMPKHKWAVMDDNGSVVWCSRVHNDERWNR